MTDELTRRGYDAELRRHRENLVRAVRDARYALDQVDSQLNSGSNELTGDTRRLLAAAGEAVQNAGMLSAANQLVFTVES